MANTLRLRKDAIGLIEGLAEASASLLKIASGWFSDRIGKRKPVVLAGYVLSTTVKPLLSLVQVGWHVLAVRIADRIGKGVRTSARDALVAESVEPGHRGRAFGFHRGMDTAGAVVGTVLAMVLLGLYLGDYRRVFLVATIAGVAAVVTVIVGVRETSRGAASQEDKPEKPEYAGSLGLFLVAHTIFSAGNFSYAFFLLRAEDVGIRAGLVPALYLLHNVVYAAAAMPAGAMFDRFGPRVAQVIAYLSHALACLGFALFGAPNLMPWWFALYGIQLAATGACSRATVSGLIRGDRRGTGMGVFHACEGGGLLVASVVGGVLWERLSSGAAPFYYGAIVAAIAAGVVSRALRGPKARPGRAEASEEGTGPEQ